LFFDRFIWPVKKKQSSLPEDFTPCTQMCHHIHRLTEADEEFFKIQPVIWSQNILPGDEQELRIRELTQHRLARNAD
jgi:hypothetical protein